LPAEPTSNPGRCALWGLLAAVMVFLWQWGTVQANHRGNWTALFYTGGLQRLPELAQAEKLYLFPGSRGYDGQFYHYLAHDPALRTELRYFLDDPLLRGRRILAPALAFLLAGGNKGHVDAAMVAVFVLSVALGVYWSARLAERHGRRREWGLLFVLFPAPLVSMDRLVVDGTMAALTAGVLWAAGGPLPRLWVLLAAAALTRETGLLLIAGVCAAEAWQGQRRRPAILASSALPAAVWFAYIATRAPARSYDLGVAPFAAMWRGLMQPEGYRAGMEYVDLLRAMDWMALAGMCVGFGLAVWLAVRGPMSEAKAVALAFTAMGILLTGISPWHHAYDFGRVYTPFLLCLAAVALKERRGVLALPALLIVPRVAVQLGPQTVGIWGWLTRG
jgi:hypothetical protein